MIKICIERSVDGVVRRFIECARSLTLLTGVLSPPLGEAEGCCHRRATSSKGEGRPGRFVPPPVESGRWFILLRTNRDARPAGIDGTRLCAVLR